MLALGNDETLKALAIADITGASAATAQVKLGNSWWELAEKSKGTSKTHIQRRAAHWYQKAMPSLTGLAKSVTQKRLSQIEVASSDSKSPIFSSLPRGVAAVYTFDKKTIGRKGEAWFARDLSGKWRPAQLVGGKSVKGVAGEGFAVSGKSYVDLGIPNTPAPKTVVFWAKSDVAGDKSLLFFGFHDPKKVSRFYVSYDQQGILSLGLGNSGFKGERVATLSSTPTGTTMPLCTTARRWGST